MKLYQLICLVSSELSGEELKSLREKVNSLIQAEGGVLNEISLPVKRRLAYEIKKQRWAYFLDVNFYLEPERLENLEKKIKSEKKILRYLVLIKKFPKKALKVPVLPKKPKPKVKVELKDLEKKLEEILGE